MAQIKVGDITPRNQYTSAASQTAFTYAFPIFSDADIKVYVGTTLKTLTTDYTVSGAGDDNGGTVTLVTGATTGDIITILRDMPVQRTSDYQTNGDFLADTVNDDFDKLVMMAQQNESELSRKLGLQLDDEDATMTLPLKDTRATKMLGFDADGDAVMSGSTMTDIDASVAAAFAGGVLASSYQFTGTGSQVAFTITGGVTAIPNAQALIITIDGVTQHTDTYTTAAAVVTFSTAPPLNADIQIRYNAYLGTATDAASATYNQGGTGASSRTVENKLQESVSVKDFGAVGDGVTDDTAAIQAAIDSFISVSGGTILFENKVYLITGTLVLREGTTLKGISESSYKLGTTPFVPQLLHDPAISGAHLMTLVSTASAFLYGVTINGLNLKGQTDGTEGDAMYFDKPGFLTIENVITTGFVNGLNILAAIFVDVRNSVFSGDLGEGVSLASVRIRYTSQVSTTVRFSKCYLKASDWGCVIDDSAALHTVFDDCVFESNWRGAANIYRGVSDTEFTNCYSEDNPTVTSTTKASPIIQLGVDGTSTVATANNLTIAGGNWSGINATVDVGSSFISADYSAGITVTGANISRVGDYIKTTANTLRVVTLGNQGAQVADWVGGYYDLKHVVGDIGYDPSGGLGTKRLRAMGFQFNNGTTQWNLETTAARQLYLTDDTSGIMARFYGATGNLNMEYGDFVATLAGKGLIMTNSAGTITKRVRLDNAGTGLLFEVP